jgi:hypothetical protein
MSDVVMIFSYIVIVFVVGLMIGTSYRLSTATIRVLKAVFAIGCIVMIICALTGCMLVKCDNCSFYDQPDGVKELPVKGKK